MFYKPRYLHVPTPYGEKYRGFSVLLQPAEDPSSVVVRVTFCSKDDHFSRKAARLALNNKSAFHIPVRNLPAKLEEFLETCDGYSMDWTRESYMKGNSFAWIWKYFL